MEDQPKENSIGSIVQILLQKYIQHYQKVILVYFSKIPFFNCETSFFDFAYRFLFLLFLLLCFLFQNQMFRLKGRRQRFHESSEVHYIWKNHFKSLLYIYYLA